MIVVIQDSAGRQPQAGHMKARDGRRVLFVADPSQAPAGEDLCHARPDYLSNFGAPWRSLVQSYNANPRDNPLGLLPAWQLYPEDIYRQLIDQLGSRKTFILSACWGLIKASYLTPNYDITLDPDAEPFRLRRPADSYTDFCMLPADSDEELHFFGSAAWVPLFCQLTAAHAGPRIVHHHSTQPLEALGCELRSFESDDPVHWWQQCAADFLTARAAARSGPGSDTASDDETATPATAKVSSIEARLMALQKATRGAASTAEGGAEAEAEAVRTAIHAARREIEAYRWLRRALPDVDVTMDEEFQRRFNAHFRIAQRSRQWHAVYYRLLETFKVVGAEFVDVLYELWEDTGRYEPAFASRLVATIDPDRPVWDRFALMQSGLRAPAYLDPDKLRKAEEVYRQLREWYADYLQSDGGRRILELFDETAPDFADLGPQKKLEFVLRHMHAERRLFTVAG